MSHTKEQTRESVLFHLKTMKEMGLKEIPRQKKNKAPARKTQESPTELTAHLQDLKMPAAGAQRPATTLPALLTHIGDCKLCKLCSGRTNLVFGVGNPKAELMFVGEAPGADEDEQGIPFVGRAGQLLTKIIESMGYQRDEIYIANVVKCRPPENRNPEPDEIASCMPFLKSQIQIIKPKVVMCLGKFASQTILNTEIPISKIRGTFQEVDGIQVMPAFHPAYLLRNPSMKKIMWEDCKKVMELLGKVPPK